MDKTSLIGLIVGIIAVFVGMILKGVNVTVLFNIPALLIIVLGTVGAVTIAFPTQDIKKVPKLFGILFKENNSLNVETLIPLFVELSSLARREGLLALESKVEEIDDPFLKNGLNLAVDGQPHDFIRDVMTEEIEAMEDRHHTGASIFTQAGTYAPTLGVLGAVVGLIAALADMSDIDKLGHAISAAFVATLFGIFTGYVLWHPFANKLKRKSKYEVNIRYLMIEGVMSIVEGQAPAVIERKLASFLSISEREKVLARRDSQQGEADG
ncbi:flagellar motor stator protein MotA [Priestia endophytica]|jgi:chemotaxis protein MotA|uniref:flagellar motor stator protein MotA n=1 Tax=Priestia endophytica TaxID=135735 RepID=UPI000DCA4AB5|nr:flagellar motor stator protein MotA [Priestia endophytica]KAB2492475.1 flagellar motor stator protein MotA [Priestia endophytica]RAS78518.1 flagellar motor protein MotA [Priestia endophytica]RAS82907.1 flagellar motor protein MotA [Priestia endophytica]